MKCRVREEHTFRTNTGSVCQATSSSKHALNRTCLNSSYGTFKLRPWQHVFASKWASTSFRTVVRTGPEHVVVPGTMAGIGTQTALATDTATNSIPATAPAFEPQPPDTAILAAQVFVLLITAAAAGYWWTVVVPSERAALGRSKRLGPLDGYLQELERPEAVRTRRVERWFYTDWLRQREERRSKRQLQQLQQQQQHQEQHQATADGTADGSAAPTPDNTKADGDDVYGSDQPYDNNLLRPSAVTPTPRFLSLDNPIVMTAALLLMAAAGAALQQR